MNEIVELTAGVIRTSRSMNDGRTIRYYDTAGQSRTAIDERPHEEQPGIGELRLDPLLMNGWLWLLIAKAEFFFHLKSYVRSVLQLVSCLLKSLKKILK